MIDDPRVIEDDERYIMAAPGIMVAADSTALREYRKQSSIKKQERDEINTLKDRLSAVESELFELRELVEILYASTSTANDN